jgi:hypothetical protein
MSKRTSSRDRIVKLERFVRAFDEWVVAGQRVSTVEQEDKPHAVAVHRQKQAELQRARAYVGELDG